VIKTDRLFAMSSPTNPAPFVVRTPVRHSAPLVFASPHSGVYYPPAFLKRACLTLRVLRRLEDAYVDRLFAFAPDFGAPLLQAGYARAYLDLNRAANELDPGLFGPETGPKTPETGPKTGPEAGSAAALPRRSGVLPRWVGVCEIYGAALPAGEAERRIADVHAPYHRRLAQLIATTRERFGHVLAIDCHSMPATASPADIVLGDRFGASCAPAIPHAAAAFLRRAGLDVVHNEPYAGGYGTAHYAAPECGVHTMQIEINRRLYMDETTHEPHAGLTRLRDMLRGLAAVLASALGAASPGKATSGAALEASHPA
jgi:N-formylglutamate amidohydrolase